MIGVLFLVFLSALLVVAVPTVAGMLDTKIGIGPSGPLRRLGGFVALIWREAVPRRRKAGLVALAILTLGVGSLAIAGPLGFFDAWTGTGNGRGGQSAARFTCNNSYRGRTWALYGASAASSDVLQICLFSTAGGGTYVFKGVNTTANGT